MSDLVAKTRFPAQQIEEVLEALNKARILRAVEPPPDRPDEPRYEVFHDVLAQAILNWQTQYTTLAELVEAERLRRRRLALTALVVLLVVSLGLSAYALYQSNQARINANRAVKQANIAEAEKAEARKQLDRANDLQSRSSELLVELRRLEKNPGKQEQLDFINWFRYKNSGR